MQDQIQPMIFREYVFWKFHMAWLLVPSEYSRVNHRMVQLLPCAHR
jgi:hypothetical protein